MKKQIITIEIEEKATNTEIRNVHDKILRNIRLGIKSMPDGIFFNGDRNIKYKYSVQE